MASSAFARTWTVPGPNAGDPNGAGPSGPNGPNGADPSGAPSGPNGAATKGAGQALATPTGAGPNGAGHPGLAPGTAGGATAGFDSTRFRAVLGHYATGVVAITAVDPVNGVPTGLAANSFTSVSLDPPLVAFCVAHTSTTWPTLRVARRLCVNVLGAEQLGLCRQFATKGAEKFRDVSWVPSPGGAPVLADALAWIECGIEAEYEAGDHVIVLCQVYELGHRHGAGPLLFYRGGYGSFAG